MFLDSYLENYHFNLFWSSFKFPFLKAMSFKGPFKGIPFFFMEFYWTMTFIDLYD